MPVKRLQRSLPGGRVQYRDGAERGVGTQFWGVESSLLGSTLNVSLHSKWLQIVTHHLVLQGWSHCPLQPLTFDTPWKEFRVEIRREVLCTLRKTGRIGLQIDIFRRRLCESNVFHLLIRRKTWTSWIETAVPCGQQPSSAKICACLHLPSSPSSCIWWPSWLLHD